MPDLASRFNWWENTPRALPRCHAAMTLVYLAIAFLCGILTGHVLRSEGVLGCAPPAAVYPLALALSAAALLLGRRSRGLRLASAMLLFVALGAWRYDANAFDRRPDTGDLAFWQSEEGVWGTVEGIVAGYPQVRDGGVGYDLAVEQVTVDGQSRVVAGRARIEAPSYPVFAYGDRLRVRGLLLTPPISDGFDYRRYLAVRGIRTLMRRPSIERLDTGAGSLFWRSLYAFRTRASLVINRNLPEPAAALTNGMVLGIEGGISQAVNDAFRATGTSHLIVISGSNIAFLAGALLAALGGFLPKRRAALIAAPLILIYVLLVGADPPALRAGVMGLFALGAVFFGRRGAAYVSLCAAGLVMLALNPLTFWDIGFELSFLTSLGLILFSRPLSHGLLSALRLRLPLDTAKRMTRVLESTLIVTVAAQAAVLPLILFYFGQLSPVSLLANLLVLPVQPIILAGGIAALLGGLVWQPLGQVIGMVPWLFLTYTVGVIKAAAALPFASVDVGRGGPGFVAGCYILLAAAAAAPRLVSLLRRRPALRQAGAWTAALAAPVCLSLLLWRALPDGRLRVVFIPAAEGEAALIVRPDGRTAWVWDGRGDGEALVEATRRSGWVRGKPDLALTQCDRTPWVGGRCVDPAGLAPGAVVALTEKVRLERLDAGADPALLLTYGQFRALLPATLSPEAQQGLRAVGPLSVLKTAGPGTGTWPAIDFLTAARPQLALWPLETTYPPGVAAHLEKQTATARVEAAAAAEIVTDGKRFWLVRHSPVSPR